LKPQIVDLSLFVHPGICPVPPYQAINQAAGLIIPEIILLATVCIMFLAGPFLVSETGKAPEGLRHRWGILSLLALAAAMFAWMKAPDPGSWSRAVSPG
jgi:hypothetical protein